MFSEGIFLIALVGRRVHLEMIGQQAVPERTKTQGQKSTKFTRKHHEAAVPEAGGTTLRCGQWRCQRQCCCRCLHLLSTHMQLCRVEGMHSKHSHRRDLAPCCEPGASSRSEFTAGPPPRAYTSGSAEAGAAADGMEESEPAAHVTLDDLRARSPLLREMPAFDGGTQGLPSNPLLRDDDGDEAHEFLVMELPRPLQSPRSRREAE